MADLDKSWMQLQNRLSPEYRNGVEEFLDYAFAHTDLRGRISCPCIKCNNNVSKTRDEVKSDMIVNGVLQNYTCWIAHGESSRRSEYVSDEEEEEEDEEVDDMERMIHDAFGYPNVEAWADEANNGHEPEQPNNEAARFFRLLNDVEQNLYPGCENISRLSVIVKLFQLKCLYGWSNKSFDELLKFLKWILPVGDTLPKSFYKARKILRDLGLDYQKIDACINDCMLYRKEYAKAEQCVVCGESRWKSGGTDSDNETSSPGTKRNKIPVKTMRYFPLKERLQRLFMSSKTASDMRWHHDGRIKDGVLRHPADSQAWKRLDELHPSFALEPRNVRLGLASDGFNPFGNMSISYSTWPVILVPYNLPPWMCMKQPFFMLSTLIPGPKAPGNNIDVYLQPMIEELKELWEVGVETYDASTKQNFRMHAAVLWTINDFPAYANLSGWSTKGALACPTCNKDTCSYRLTNGRKSCYMGHRRWLPLDHKWRKNKKSFDGNKELRSAPMQLSGDDVLDQLRRLKTVTFGKTVNKPNEDPAVSLNWKKKSIFFELPYWKTLLLRHNLDVMHIEKNVCDSVLGTLLNIEGKTKDHLKARLDLETRFNRQQRNYEGVDARMHEGLPIFSQTGRPLGKQNKTRELTLQEMLQARLYVLKNCDEVTPFREEHMRIVESTNVRNVDEVHKHLFPEWFEKRVAELVREGDGQVTNQLFQLSRGPSTSVASYKGYLVNGYRFHTKSHANYRKTQNSGVVVKGDDETEYFGVLKEIVELNYIQGYRVVLFKCDWFDIYNVRGVNKDNHGFISVNTRRTFGEDEPYVLACQAEQVFYVPDSIKDDWLVVVKTQPRDFYNMPYKDEIEEEVEVELEAEAYQQNDSNYEVSAYPAIDNNDEVVTWGRNDVPGESVDASLALPIVHGNDEDEDEDGNADSDYNDGDPLPDWWEEADDDVEDGDAVSSDSDRDDSDGDAIMSDK